MNVFAKTHRETCPKGLFSSPKGLYAPLKRLTVTLKRVALPLLTLCGMALIVAFPDASMQGVKKGVTLWFNAVLPALFPFFFLSLLLSKSEALPRAERLLAPACRALFSLPARTGIILLTAFLSGYPIGAKLIESAVSSGALSVEEGRKASAFCITSGPLFLMGTVGLRFFQSVTVGRILLLTHFFSALLCGVLFGKIRPVVRRETKNFTRSGKNSLPAAKTAAPNEETAAPNEKHAAPKAETAATDTTAAPNTETAATGNKKSDPVYEATLSMLSVCGAITLLSVLLDLLGAIGVIQALSAPLSLVLGDKNLSFSTTLGLIEVTRGCEQIAAQGVFPLSVALSSALLSFGGVSVFLQSSVFLSRVGISIKTCILGKGMQAIFSFLIAFLLAVAFGL